MMKRVRLRLKRLSENAAVGRFPSRKKSLAGSDFEGVRPLRPGDAPTFSSFDILHSILYRRYFLRVRKAERTMSMLIALDNTPSMAVAFGDATPRSVEFALAREMVEGFADGGNEVGFVLWSHTVDEFVLPVSGVNRIQDRLADLSQRLPGAPPTLPEKVFDHMLGLQKKPAITFVFSDWRDAGDFGDSLKRCLVSDLDIVPVVITGSRRPRRGFLGDALFQSAETGLCEGFSGMMPRIAAIEIFRSLSLPVINIDVSAPETSWEDAFEKYFDSRDKERR